MNNFEKIYSIEPLEKYPSIELTDQEHLKRNELLKTGNFVKFNKEKNITQDTQVIDLISAEPPLISMNLDMPELEKVIKKGERKKNKTTKPRVKK